MTTLSPALRKAFEETQYHVLHQAPFGLQVGQAQPALAAIYLQHQTDCACLITAFNPMGELLDKDENIARHAQLGRALGAVGRCRLRPFGMARRTQNCAASTARPSHRCGRSACHRQGS